MTTRHAIDAIDRVRAIDAICRRVFRSAPLFLIVPLPILFLGFLGSFLFSLLPRTPVTQIWIPVHSRPHCAIAPQQFDLYLTLPRLRVGTMVGWTNYPACLQSPHLISHENTRPLGPQQVPSFSLGAHDRRIFLITNAHISVCMLPSHRGGIGSRQSWILCVTLRFSLPALSLISVSSPLAEPEIESATHTHKRYVQPSGVRTICSASYATPASPHLMGIVGRSIGVKNIRFAFLPLLLLL
ncbi:hypothetical protein SCHPADRAFT_173393 [Schizopora paradoxa]|uniref:Uncharacterized protein n=1 Tax=Schizopora paradoxa TaxID=27342 RepID=A0A0H2S6L1_9AGAM|nr:hypothetical protein SCHPADRAFT_173393 [Schizopora paradoxa]